MIPFGRQPVHYPCAAVGPIGPAAEEPPRSIPAGTECLIVEGDSAAKSVDQVRHRRLQAILALQGKPLNAIKAGQRAAMKNEVVVRIFETLLGYRVAAVSDPSRLLTSLEDPARCVYEKIVLLMDPDADGIHCGVLLMGFFRRFAPALIRSGRLHIVHPPMFVFRLPVQTPGESSRWPVASSPEHAEAIEKALQEHGMQRYEKIRHRGLGSLDSAVLRHSSVDPTTRSQSPLTMEQVDAAIALFSSG